MGYMDSVGERIKKITKNIESDGDWIMIQYLMSYYKTGYSFKKVETDDDWIEFRDFIVKHIDWCNHEEGLLQAGEQDSSASIKKLKKMRMTHFFRELKTKRDAFLRNIKNTKKYLPGEVQGKHCVKSVHIDRGKDIVEERQIRESTQDNKGQDFQKNEASSLSSKQRTGGKKKKKLKSKDRVNKSEQIE